MADTPQQDTNNLYGPFTQNLTSPLTPQSEQMQVSYAPSRAGALAGFANAFLKGAISGQMSKYQRDERTKYEQERNLDSVFAHISSSPNISVEGKKLAEQQYLQAKYTKVAEATKGADKEHKDNPILGLVKSITGHVLGPSEDKNHKNVAIDVNTLLNIANDPKYQVDPNAASAASINSTQTPQTGTPPQQRASTAAPAQPVTPQQGYLANKYPATPPPPGTTPAAAQPPATAYATQSEAWQDPGFQKQVQSLTAQGIDWRNTLLGQKFASLPKTEGLKPIGTAQIIQDPTDAKRSIKVQGYLDPSTGHTTYQKIGDAPATKPSTTAEKRTQLMDDMKALHPEWNDDEVKKAVAKLDVDTVTNKATPKLTDEDKLSKYLVDSGQFKTTEEAQNHAATMLVDLQKAKIKAAQNSGGGGGGAFTPQEMDALASWSIATGQQQAFGRGANDPNRIAYQKALANKFITGGIGDALSARTDLKADQGTLNNMVKLKANIDSFEGAANKALDNALAASKAVPRDSSAMVNGWDQWITKHSVDDPALQKLFVYTETAANEYARVIGSMTGASTNAARDQANSFIRSQLAEKSYEGAAEAMKTDMANRSGQINETIGGLRQSIQNIGQPSQNNRTPPPNSVPDKVGKLRQDQKYSKDIDPSQDGKQHQLKLGQPYGSTGKIVLGWTKDGHAVIED